MPQAPKYLSDQFESDTEATNYLSYRGFRLMPSWEWLPPPDHQFTKKDWDAIDYMIMQWDFGGVYDPR